MNIVLIGYRGTGKSSVAGILGRRLNRRVFSTDAEVVRRIGCPIAEFLARKGWEPFRDIESEVCRGLGSLKESVIDCGGGVVVRPENVSALRAGGRVYWLTADPATIAERIREDGQRPSLTAGKSFLEEIEEVLEKRLELYREAADREVSTVGRTPELVAEAVLRELE